MAKLDKKELAKLSPADRIKRLKKIEEESKKEIEEAEKLIKESKSEIEKEQLGSRVAVPEAKQVDITELFEQPESQLEQSAKQAEEEAADEEKIKYQVAQDYEELKGLREEAYTQPSDDFLQKVDRIGERLEKISYQTTGEQTTKMLVASQSLIYKIRKYAGLEHGGKRW